MVGIGGYGYYYLKTLLEEFPEGSVELSGVVDPYADKSGLYPEVIKRNIPVFANIKEFYEAGHSANLAVIVSPIQSHVPQSCIALKNGSNVLCEKPLCATIEEADELIRARDESGKWVMIGYQWSYSNAIQNLKRDILKGIFGKPKQFKTLCMWPRDDRYYNRNNWAGKLKDSSGRWILDSPANNAMAHFIHNLFYLSGDEQYSSSTPKEVTAELYRVNPIETYDTAICRIMTHNNIELLFYGSHTTKTSKNPIFRLEFENAVIDFGEVCGKIRVIFGEYESKEYGSPDDDHQFKKLFEAVECVRQSQPIVCSPEAARSQTLCINAMQDYDVSTFPKLKVHRGDNEKRWWVEGLDDLLLDCYREGRFLSSTGVSACVLPT